jgi:hypothetical protein
MEIFVYDTGKSWIKQKHIISSKKQFDNLKQIKNIKDKIGELYVDKNPRVYKNRTPEGKFIRSTQYSFFYFKLVKKNKHKLLERTYHEKIGNFYCQKREAKKLGFKFISPYISMKEQEEIILKHRLSKVL